MIVKPSPVRKVVISPKVRACLLIFIGKTSIRYEPDWVEVMKFRKIGGSTQQAGSQFCLISFISRRANSIKVR
jgi:hypothetical protein